MLVLSRKKDETVVINDDIRVTIMEIRGDKVRLGIEAPQSVPVHREEVYDAIQREAKTQHGGCEMRRDQVTVIAEVEGHTYVWTYFEDRVAEVLASLAESTLPFGPPLCWGDVTIIAKVMRERMISHSSPRCAVFRQVLALDDLPLVRLLS